VRSRRPLRGPGRLRARPRPCCPLEARTKPILFTCRPESEGGRWPDTDPAGRRAMLQRAVDLGFDLVDVEARAGFDEIVAAKAGRGLVLSWHDFEGTPDDLDGICEALAVHRPDVVKIAVTARSVADLGRLLAFASRRAGVPGPRLVALAMGRSASPRASSAVATARPSPSPRPRTAARPPRASCPWLSWPTSTVSGRSARDTRVRPSRLGRFAEPLSRDPEPRLRRDGHGRRVRTAAGRVDARLRVGPAGPRALRLQRDASVQGRDPASPRLGDPHAAEAGRRTRWWRRTAGSWA